LTAGESKHHLVWQRNLARQRIEQHAHIPYTHGFRVVYDDFTTAIHQSVSMQAARLQKLIRYAAFPPQSLIRGGWCR